MNLNPQWVSAIGTWFSGIVVAFSLLFVWRQARISSGQLNVSGEQELISELANYHNLYLMWFNVDRIFVEYPDLRDFFYSRADSRPRSGVTDDIRKKLDAVSHMMLDCFDDVYHHLDHLPAKTRVPWDLFMQDMYRHTPYIKSFLQDNEQWYSPDFVRYLKDGPTQQAN
jgi:hypothetical protein